MNKKLWGGRFSEQTHPDVDAFTASISFDQALAEEDILGSMAHAKMLAHCQIITDDECQQLQTGLQDIALQIKNNDFHFSVAHEDIHMSIEHALKEKIGVTANKLHTARSRNDQVALDLHLYLRKTVVGVVSLLTKLKHTLLMLAAQHSHVILPGYTHLQRAQPIYLAQHWLAYVAMFQRDADRLQNSFSRINISPLGAAALAGTPFNIDRDYVAKLLRMDGIYFNTLDAVSDRDFVIEFLSSASLIMMHLSRLSEELILWSSQEFNFISLDDAYCTGSSIMPQKKNPDIPELVRGKTGRVYGALLSVLTMLKGLPLAYNKDMQEDKEPLFDTVKTLCSALSIYSLLLSTLTINESSMRQATEEGFLNATALADYLVTLGAPFRVVHEIVGKMVAFCVTQKCRLEDLSLSDFQQFYPDITKAVYEVITIEHVAESYIKKKQQKRTLIEEQLMVARDLLKHQEAWVVEKEALMRAVLMAHGGEDFR